MQHGHLHERYACEGLCKARQEVWSHAPRLIGFGPLFTIIGRNRSVTLSGPIGL